MALTYTVAGDAGDRVGERHAEHVRCGERETARGGDVPAAARDESGEDRHHGQHARREGEHEPGEVEPAEHAEEAAAADERGDPALPRRSGAGAARPAV